MQGSHSGFMKSWDLQSGQFVRSFGARARSDEELEGKVQRRDLKIHKGPVKVVYVHDSESSLAFSGSARELLVWRLEEGSLVTVLADHSRPVSAVCCYQRGDTLSDDDQRHPASVVSGGEDSCLYVYSLKELTAFDLTGLTYKHKLDNQAGPVSALQIPLVALNGTKQPLPVIVAACFDGSVQLWSLGSGQWLGAVDLPHGPVTALSVLPTPVPGLLTGHGDGEVLVLSLQTLEVLTALTRENAQEQTALGAKSSAGHAQAHTPRGDAAAAAGGVLWGWCRLWPL
jgi:WD40 repeat protein